MIVSLTGFMGSGKSSTGRELSELLSYPFVDLDDYIVHKTGHSIAEIFKDGEERFRAVEAEAVRDIITMNIITGGDLVLSLGGGTFTTAPIRDLILEKTCCIYLKAGLGTCLGRTGKDGSRPMLEGDVRSLYESRLPLYEKARFTVSTEGRTARETAEEIILNLTD